MHLYCYFDDKLALTIAQTELKLQNTSARATVNRHGVIAIVNHNWLQSIIFFWVIVTVIDWTDQNEM